MTIKHILYADRKSILTYVNIKGGKIMSNNNKTGIIVRTDKKFWSDDIAGIFYFCRTCDPEGKGIGYGAICEKHSWETEEDIQNKYRFCSHCGKEIDYTDRVNRTHRMSC